MKAELQRLELITDVHCLMEIKEKLKDDTLDPMLNWRERIDLYKSIQGINDRIQILKQRLSQKPL